MAMPQLLTPSWGSIEAWNRSFDKVDDYLRAHRVASRLHRARLTAQVLSAVAARCSVEQPPGDRAIEALAIEECREIMNKWFKDLRGESHGADQALAGIDARIAIILSDAPMRWPRHFMISEDPPEEMRRQLQTLAMRAGPELAISHMVPRAMDIGFISEFAGSTMATFARVPGLKVVVAWGLYLAMLALLFYLTR